MALVEVDGRRVFAKLDRAPQGDAEAGEAVSPANACSCREVRGDPVFQLAPRPGFGLGRLVHWRCGGAPERAMPTELAATRSPAS